MGTTFRKDVSWLAFSSMLLGVMTFIMIPYFYLTVFPGLVLAHLGLWRSTKSDEPVEGKSLTIVGLVLHYGFLLAFILLPVLMTYFDDFDKRSLEQRVAWVTGGFGSKPKERQKACDGHLKVIGAALVEYSAENDGYFPDSMEGLFTSGNLTDLSISQCPGRQFYQSTTPSASDTDYVYLGKGLSVRHAQASTCILMYDKRENHRGKWINILFADGRLQGFQTTDIDRISRRHGYILPTP